MNFLIRNRLTRAFLTREGEWSREIGLALEFESSAGAMGAASERPDLQDLDIYFSFEPGRSSARDFAVAVIKPPQSSLAISVLRPAPPEACYYGNRLPGQL